MSELNFSKPIYKKIALDIKTMNNNIHEPALAFFILINGLEIKDLDNLCKYIHKHYFNNDPNISLEDCYAITQNNNLDTKTKETILNFAYELINNGKHLGNNTINDGKINTSSWISHSLNCSIVATNLAKNLNLNENNAKTLGMLHDYGRKFDHSFNHIIKGFEELVNIGYYNEALACLTHSFIRGGRCANNEPAIEGFYTDELENAKWLPDTIKDDITLFLENYSYTNYDIILNIADLMATDKKIISPYERIEDIKTRRKIDKTNRKYYLKEFINLLINHINSTSNNKLELLTLNTNTTIENIEKYFYKIFILFFNNYNELNKTKDNKQKNY